jgi:hypothetical protein
MQEMLIRTHTVNHVMDLNVGGLAPQAWLLGAVGVDVGAFALRARQLGYVLGTVTIATNQTLAPFFRQKMIRLNTFR